MTLVQRLSEGAENESKTPPVMDAHVTAKYMHCTYRNVLMLRSCGVLEGVRMGKHWVFTAEACDEFFRCWRGYDMSSKEAVMASIALKARRDRDENK